MSDLTVASFHCWSTMVWGRGGVPATKQCLRTASRMVDGVPYCGVHGTAVAQAKRRRETGTPRIRDHQRLIRLATETQVTKTLAGRDVQC